MVRLRVVLKIATYALIVFQFQHGAIKGKYGASSIATLNKFQFQHGAIKGPTQDVILIRMYNISIPTWCD